MASTLVELDAATAVNAYSIADEKIAEWSAEFMPLTIAGISDTAGLKAVHEARMTVKNQRIAIEKTRVHLKADALEYGRKVDSEAKRLTALLQPIEDHLAGEESKVEAEKERIKQAKLAAAQARVDAMLAVGGTITFVAASSMPEEEFQGKLNQATAAFMAQKEAEAAAERERIAAEEKAAADRKAEADRMAAERAELDRMRKEQEAKDAAQKAEAERLAAESRRIEEAKQAEVRKAELAKATAEAAERSRVETEQRLAREAEEAKEREEKARIAAEDEQARLAALMPDRQKLLAYADAILAVARPALSSASADASTSVERKLAAFVAAVRKLAREELV